MDLSLLINDLNCEQVSRRRQAAEGLSRHPDSQAAAVSLVRACGDPDEQVREWAAAALEGLGQPSVGDISAMSPLLNDPSAVVAYWAATLLGRLGPMGAAAVPQLAELLDSPRGMSARQRAAWALGRIGRPASSAIPALRRAAEDDNPRLARLAQQALEKVSGS
jgi:HEAT repeat protein